MCLMCYTYGVVCESLSSDWLAGLRDVQSVISDYFGDQEPRVRTAAIKAMVIPAPGLQGTCYTWLYSKAAFTPELFILAKSI